MYGYGSSFTFAGIESSTYDLMLYSAGNKSEETSIAGVYDIVEEALMSRWKPLFYGTALTKKLAFQISFGINCDRIDNEEYLTRAEVSEIANWLTRHDAYKELTIKAEGLENYIFRCMFSDIVVLGNDGELFGFSATVTCDSAFAYLPESVFSASLSPTSASYVDLTIENPSGIAKYYYPIVECLNCGGGSITIINQSDNNNTTQIGGVSGSGNIPASITSVTINGSNGVIKNNADLNLYEYFNFKFPRLVPGVNKLRISGRGSVNIKCNFPVNVGGYIGG